MTIKQASFAVATEDFASSRKGKLEDYDNVLYSHVADSMKRIGINSWENPLVDFARKLFKEIALEESDEWNQVMEDLRDEFARELRETLQKAKPVGAEHFLAQVDRTTKWMSTMIINAATEAATTADPDENVGLEWVTMEDGNVRESHKAAHGQQVPTGEKFEVGGAKLLYPGEPVGDPANWINCRCVVRPAMLSGGLTAAAPPKEDAVPKEPLDQLDEVDDEVDDDAPMIPDEAADLLVPWHGVLAPEGIPSGDGRMFAPEALTWRELPLTLKAMFIDDEGHKGSIIAGRIDRIWRDGNLVKAEGVFDASAGGYETIRMLAEKMWRGVSVDVDSAELSVEELTDEGGQKLVFSKGRISAATICTMPAFAEAYVALGPWAEEDKELPDVRENQEVEAAGEGEQFKPVPPQTKDGPGWVTHPDPTEDITNYWVDGRGAAKIRWGQGGDFNRCRRQLAKYVQNPDWLAGLCANLHYRALGIWPGEHKASGETVALKPVENAELASVTLVASAAATKERISIDYFKNPMLEEGTALQIDEETGHVYGHVALWDTCHIGKTPCVTPPHSARDYAFFLHGEVMTDAGPIPVGQITVGTGHADPNLGIIGAMAHYDNTGSAVVDVHCGEDDFGIWVSGKLRDGATPKQIHDLRAAAVSGDWRGVVVNGVEELEMCGVLAVNVPGFPIPRTRVAMSGDRQLSLVAAGMVQPEVILDPVRAARVAALQATARQFRADRIKASVQALKGGK